MRKRIIAWGVLAVLSWALWACAPNQAEIRTVPAPQPTAAPTPEPAPNPTPEPTLAPSPAPTPASESAAPPVRRARRRTPPAAEAKSACADDLCALPVQQAAPAAAEPSPVEVTSAEASCAVEPEGTPTPVEAAAAPPAGNGSPAAPGGSGRWVLVLALFAAILAVGAYLIFGRRREPREGASAGRTAMSHPLPRAEHRPEPQPAPRAEHRPEPQPAPRAEHRPEPQPAPRAERRPEPQPAPRTERRPEPQPASKVQPPAAPGTRLVKIVEMDDKQNVKRRTVRVKVGVKAKKAAASKTGAKSAGKKAALKTTRPSAKTVRIRKAAAKPGTQREPRQAKG